MNTLPLPSLIQSVTSFVPKGQLKIVMECAGDSFHEDFEQNKAYFVEILNRLKATFESMPKTYEAHANETIHREDLIVHLHYFAGRSDWWILEKDCEDEQHQAFGVVCLNGNTPEMGYISIEELTRISFVELDFHWEPTALKDIPVLEGWLRHS